MICVGFAGGYPGTHIGDIAITDGAFHDTAVAGLYGFGGELVKSDKDLTDSLCKKIGESGVRYLRGFHRTTDAGYVQPD